MLISSRARVRCMWVGPIHVTLQRVNSFWTLKNEAWMPEVIMQLNGLPEGVGIHNTGFT